jgi:hypothetical protein
MRLCGNRAEVRLPLEDSMTQSIFNIVKAPLGWLIYGDGVKVGEVFGSKEAAFEAATVAAMFAVRDGAGVQINVPSAPGRDTGKLDFSDQISGRATNLPA